jgi:hypothetical protein
MGDGRVARAGSVQGPGRHLDAATPEQLDRWRVLERLATDEGLAWAARSCEELRQQGRTIAGGWPGTVSQARLRIAVCMMSRVEPGPALTSADIDWLARTVYLTAKAEWLAQAEPGSDE